MTIKQGQDDFEKRMGEQLEANAFANTLTAAIDLYVKHNFGNDERCHSTVAPEVVGTFGVGEASVRCMMYVVKRVIQSKAVCPAYPAAQAIFDTWWQMKKFIKSGTTFDFSKEEEPPAEVRKHLRLVSNG